MSDARVIVVAGQKGGPGKTTTAMNLAATFAEAGHSVIMVDIDPQGSAAGWAETAGEDLPFDFTSSDDPQLLAQMGALPYDYVIVDTPGSLVEREKNQALIPAADFIVIPTHGDPLGMGPLANIVHQVIKPAGVPFRVLLNNVSDRRGASWPHNTTRTLVEHGMPCFRTHIRSYHSLTDSPGNGAVVTQINDRTGRGSARLYAAVMRELVTILDEDEGATR